MSFHTMEQELYSLKGPHRKGEDHQEFFHRFSELTSNLDPKKNLVVVGTNGKGTTCQLLFHLLRGAGFKVGLFTSPHLVHLSERFRYEDEHPSEAELISLRKRAAEKLAGLPVSFFETLTVMAVEWFSDLEKAKGLDFVVWEAGLGGRFDPAARVPHNITIMTTISLDHQELLGKTLPEIAWNKIGALSTRGVLVSNSPGPEWESVVRDELHRKGATWVRADKVCPVELGETTTLDLQQLTTPWGETRLRLLGTMAKSNLQLALCGYHQATERDPTLTNLHKLHFWGRTQWLKEFKVPVLLSGDHNPEGWEHLCQWLKRSNFRGVLLYRLNKEEKRSSFFTTMSQCGQFKLVEGSQTELVKQFNEVEASLPSGEIVVITGSLYFVGDWMKAMGLSPLNNI